MLELPRLDSTAALIQKAQRTHSRARFALTEGILAQESGRLVIIDGACLLAHHITALRTLATLYISTLLPIEEREILADF